MTEGPTRRRFVQTIGAAGAATALTGCDSAVDALAQLFEETAGAGFQPPAADEIDLESHVLNRLTWGAPPGEYQRVVAMGADAFIEEQLQPALLPDRRSEWRVAAIESLAEPAGELYEYHPRQLLQDLTRAKLLRGVYSRRQLFEVMVDFWTDHFNIVNEKGHCKWLKAADDRDVIRANALGRFRDLVRASAVSPAMLIYLDGHDNKVETPGDRPNENYARELLELHTLGVHGGYTQHDVAEVARCLSGWTYQHKPLKFRPAHVEFVSARHDQGAKTVLGRDIPAGGGADDLERVLDIVCAHPATARHLARKLCRRFIADPAPSDAVDTVADSFLRSDGDIKQVLRTLFTADAFRESRGNLLKRPLRFVIGTLRATGASTDAGPPVTDAVERMGHAPFRYPTPDGYPLEAAPWLGSMLWRWDFALRLQAGTLKGTTVDPAELIQRLGDLDGLSAHLLGRRPTALESEVLAEGDAPLALLLSCPAFQQF